MVQRFLAYLGTGFRLPTVTEWRALLAATEDLAKHRSLLVEACQVAAPPVRCWLEQGFYPLAREGLLECVDDGGAVRYIGHPWTGLLPNTWSPVTVRDLNWKLARRAVGFKGVSAQPGEIFRIAL